jgi:RNA polymerase-binding transcription factor
MKETVKKSIRGRQDPKNRTEASANSAEARALLEGDRETHLRELDELRSELMEQAETDAEQADPVMSEKGKNLALLHQIEEHVAEIDHAIEAAKQGTYGVCERCGELIDPERLRILPETRLCIHCKGQLERTAHHHRRRV